MHIPGPKSAVLGPKALQTSFLTLYQCKLVSRSASSNPKIALICPPQISTYLAPKSADNLTCCDGGQSIASVWIGLLQGRSSARPLRTDPCHQVKRRAGLNMQRPFQLYFEQGRSFFFLQRPRCWIFFWSTGTTPILEKSLRECRGKWKSFGWVRGNSGNRSESCSENCGFRIDQVVRGHSENGISYSENGISNSESCSENTPELSESSENGFFTPRAFFLKLGWSPGFWFLIFSRILVFVLWFSTPMSMLDCI